MIIWRGYFWHIVWLLDQNIPYRQTIYPTLLPAMWTILSFRSKSGRRPVEARIVYYITVFGVFSLTFLRNYVVYGNLRWQFMSCNYLSNRTIKEEPCCRARPRDWTRLLGVFGRSKRKTALQPWTSKPSSATSVATKRFTCPESIIQNQNKI